ncbi:MAG TPA: hypothetical protein DCR20_02840 [Planctomycetaceae bacterium]|jgi:hypothetical protein|nr:hypothetical protein [Planctomycetaceae bacterium]
MSATGIDLLRSAETPEHILDTLEQALLDQQDFHRWFDARMIRARRQLGLPLTQPTSLRDIPEAQEAEWRKAYTDAARDAGYHFLRNNLLADAWAYFRTIREPQPVRDAIEQLVQSSDGTPGADTDEVLNVALYEAAHPVAGITLLLRTHGTCNTVTALSQMIGQMTPAERRQAAAVMVRHLYADLLANVRRDVERRQPALKPDLTLRELIAGREFLFADGNYHIDVSHLHSIVGFARHLHREDPELRLAIDMSLYGQQLSEHLRYPADVPFDDYYSASEQFLQAVAGIDVAAGLNWFTQRLQQEPDAPDQRLIAFVLVDLAQRCGKTAEILPIAAPHLSRMEDPNGFSFTACCVESGRLDLLETTALENNDLLALATVLLVRQTQPPASA